MAETQPTPAEAPFPLTRAVAILLGAWLAVFFTLRLLLVNLGVSSAVDEVVSYLAMAVIGSTLLSIAPVGLLGRHGVMPTVYGYFGGAALRFTLLQLAAVLLLWGRDFSPVLPVLCMMAMYLPLLFIEAGLVGRYLWNKDFMTPGAAQRPREVVA